MADITGLGTTNFAKLLLFLKDKLEPGDYQTAKSMLTDSDDITKPDVQAMDWKGNTMADRSTIREMQSIRLAEEEVAPYAGPILGMDSAGAVYRTALEKMGHDVSKVPVHAVTREVFQAMRQHKGRSLSMAKDSAARTDFDARFPNANRLYNGVR